MKRTKIQLILSYALGVMMVFAGISHFASPEMYTAMVPSFLPEALSNYGAGALEVFIGVALFIPSFRIWGALGFTILMTIFQFIHVADLFRDEPVLIAMLMAQNPTFDASQAMPILVFRVIMQFLLIFIGFWLYRKDYRKDSSHLRAAS